MKLRKFKKAVKRHSLLYKSRFKLLGKNSYAEAITVFDYNSFNTKDSIPLYFQTINKEIFANGKPREELEVIVKLCTWLRQHIKGGRGLSEPSEDALKLMLAGKGGVCSDMVQIFNNFCVINDIRVREWGITSIPFDKTYGGHSFNEVYIKAVNKWVMVDASKCLFFYTAKQPLPLSTLELFKLLRQDIAVHSQTFYETEHSSEKSIQKNYLHPKASPFLVCNYRNAIYDRFLKRLKPYFPVFVIHFIIYLIGKSYHYRFPLDDYKKLFA